MAETWTLDPGKLAALTGDGRGLNLSPEDRRIMAIHEAGHAVVAMYMGKDIYELRIGDEGGYCLSYAPRWKRSWHACSSLAGLFAVAIHCRDLPGIEEFNNWAHCDEDMRLFNAERGGMTYRQGRRLTLGILRDPEVEARLLALAATLERDGFVDFTNAGPMFT